MNSKKEAESEEQRLAYFDAKKTVQRKMINNSASRHK